MYPTEASMKGAAADVPYNILREFESVNRDLGTPGSITNPQDRSTAEWYKSYLIDQMQKQGIPVPGIDAPANSIPNIATPGINPGASSAPAYGPFGGGIPPGAEKYDLTKPENVERMKSEETGIVGKIKSVLGDVGFVVLGVVIIGIAGYAAIQKGPEIAKQIRKAM